MQFKDAETGKYLTAISTKQTDKDEAIKTAWNWYAQGKITRQDRKQTLENVSLWETMRKADISDMDAEKVLDFLKKRDILKSYVKTGAKNDIPLVAYMADFWDWEKSEYIQEKLKEHWENACKKSAMLVRKYWSPFLLINF